MNVYPTYLHRLRKCMRGPGGCVTSRSEFQVRQQAVITHLNSPKFLERKGSSTQNQVELTPTPLKCGQLSHRHCKLTLHLVNISLNCQQQESIIIGVMMHQEVRQRMPENHPLLGRGKRGRFINSQRKVTGYFYESNIILEALSYMSTWNGLWKHNDELNRSSSDIISAKIMPFAPKDPHFVPSDDIIQGHKVRETQLVDEREYHVPSR